MGKKQISVTSSVRQWTHTALLYIVINDSEAVEPTCTGKHLKKKRNIMSNCQCLIIFIKKFTTPFSNWKFIQHIMNTLHNTSQK